MTREEVFTDIYEELALRLANPTLNPYGASITSFVPPLQDGIFPNITLYQGDYRLHKEALNKTEQKYYVMITAEVYAVNTPTQTKRIIANQVADLVETTIKDDYGFSLMGSDPVPNLDENIHRIMLRFSAIIDADSLTIYRQ